MAQAISSRTKLVSIRLPVELLDEVAKLVDSDSGASLAKLAYPDFRDVTTSNVLVGLVRQALNERKRKASY
jgi:hypothetical protein